MRFLRSWLLVAVALLAVAAGAAAQTTNGTLSGHVADQQGLALPGVTVNVTSPSLQGIRDTVTSENGDYVLPGLPSGVYTVVFELSGFERVTKTVSLAPTQILPLDAQMGPAAISETVNVVGKTADVLTNTAQVATNFKQEMIALLPTNRDINASLLQAPGVHVTGPSGAPSIAGAASFESLFMVNGVAITENVRGTPFDLYIEDAIQETTVAVGGVSAEFGRFGGGVVNVITKSGGNLFAGSFRDTINDDNWRTLTPFEVTAIAADPAHKDTRIAKAVPSYEYYVSGPVKKDKLWFFTAGRLTSQESGRTLIATNIPYTYTDESQRYEFKGTYAATSAHRFQGDYLTIAQTQKNYTFNTSASMDTRSLGDRKLPEKLYTFNYSGVLSDRVYVEAPVLRPPVRLRGRRREVDGPHPGDAAHRSEPRGRGTGPTRSAASAGPSCGTTTTSSSRAPTSCRRKAAARTRCRSGTTTSTTSGTRTTTSRAATTASWARRPTSCRPATSCRSFWAITRRSFSTTRYRS